MPEKSDRLINLTAECDALHHASGGASLEGVLARISADVTNQAAEAREHDKDKGKEKPIRVMAIKTAEIDAKAHEDSWPENIVFPLTPIETWYLLRGYSIKPEAEISSDILRYFPGSITFINGFLKLN